MVLRLIDIYNKTAEQAWSMFDAEVESKDEFEAALLSSIQKALVDLWCSYPFPFRERDSLLQTQAGNNSYELPCGNIKERFVEGKNQYCVKLEGKYLKYSASSDFDNNSGKPDTFYLTGEALCLYPIPDDVYDVEIEYLTLFLGKDEEQNALYNLKNENDYIDIPIKYETLFLNALTTKAMLYAIASKGDENYSGYLMQYNEAYKNLLNYCTGINTSQRVIW